jgi:hypothetical protein
MKKDIYLIWLIKKIYNILKSSKVNYRLYLKST